jgi:putative NADH-flavin reductase
MKIAVYGATGRVGSRIVAEAVNRGHHVTALSRHEAAVPAGATWQHGDVADTNGVAAVAAGHDAVVTANGPSRRPGEDPFAFAALIAGVAGAVGSTRLLVVGGAGSLLDETGTRLVDSPDFPTAYRTEALATSEALARLRASGPELDWTYLSPAPEIDEGERTGSYRVAADTPAGSWISFADYAVALVDELERPAHRRARFTVASR